MADTFTVTVEKAGVEDIEFGEGTYQRTSSDGTTVLTIKKVNSDHLPVVDDLEIFKHTYLSDVLVELYELFSAAKIQTWYYQDDNGEILHGMGNVINQPADVTAKESWYQYDENGTLIMSMGDALAKFNG